jgi:hypothetical protein
MYELQAVLVSVRGGDPATLWERWQPAYNIGQEVGIDRGEPLQFEAEQCRHPVGIVPEPAR